MEEEKRSVNNQATADWGRKGNESGGGGRKPKRTASRTPNAGAERWANIKANPAGRKRAKTHMEPQVRTPGQSLG